MASATARLLVLGLGNLVCGDDGAGVAAALRLQWRYRAPEGTEVHDGGTLGLALLPRLRSARNVILLDAVAADLPAGSLVRFEGDEVPDAVVARLSPHQVGVADLLGSARLLGGLPENIVLLGVVPEDLGLSVKRSAAVEASLPALVERAVEEARAFGVEFEPRSHDDQPDAGDARLARLFGLEDGGAP